MKDLRTSRKEKGLTQPQLEELTGIEVPNISALEHGRYKPNQVTRKKIEKALGEKIDWSETSKLHLQSTSYFKTERLVNKLIGSYIQLNNKDKKAIKQLINKYLTN
jgi:transcriptional regulator with XRE-family HTH domain